MATKVFPTTEAALQYLVEKCSELHEGDGLVLSVGATFRPLIEILPAFPVDVFVADERMVPQTDPRSNSGFIQQHWIDRHANVPASQRPVLHLPATDQPADWCAVEYESEVRQYQDRLKLALLGIGKGDGHVASIFPGQFHEWNETAQIVMSADAEQEPVVPRITLAPAVLKGIPKVIYAAFGDEKREIVRRVLRDREQVPARMITGEDTEYILDAAAAADLPEDLYENVETEN